jgi:hypothetical protein
VRRLWRGENNPSLAASLGNAYAIAPDVVVSRAPVSDEEINAHRILVDDTVATHAALRASVQLGAVAPVGYAELLEQVKVRVRTSRVQAARAVNTELVGWTGRSGA